jgi:hypothetical protein
MEVSCRHMVGSAPLMAAKGSVRSEPLPAPLPRFRYWEVQGRSHPFLSQPAVPRGSPVCHCALHGNENRVQRAIC